jgi:hypothetical protein
MTVTSKPIITSKYASITETSEYEADAGMRTILDKFTGYNGSAASVVVTVKLVPKAAAAGASHIGVSRAIQAGETYTFPEIVGHALEPEGFISVIAATASAVVIRASGREIT